MTDTYLKCDTCGQEFWDGDNKIFLIYFTGVKCCMECGGKLRPHKFEDTEITKKD